MEWLKQETPQKILFRNRIEYKKKGVYHNIKGPAIESLDNKQTNIYYIKGQKLTYEEWLEESLVYKRRKKLKNIKFEE